MKTKYPNGYILKKNFEEKDRDGTTIDVNLPQATENLNLGKITFEQKYPQQRKLQPAKLEDLKKMRPSLYLQGGWIEDLVEDQVNAKEYTKDDNETIFPAETLGKNYYLECDRPTKITDPRTEAEEYESYEESA